jgi:hypothetical protein
MAAKNALSKQLFHGTNRIFNPGDVILPQDVTGVESPTVIDESSYGEDKEDFVRSLGHLSRAHASGRVFTAGIYAERATRHLGGDFSIYRVKPVNPSDVYHDTSDEWASPTGFKVVRRLPFENMSVEEMAIDSRMQSQWDQAERRSWAKGERKRWRQTNPQVRTVRNWDPNIPGL